MLRRLPVGRATLALAVLTTLAVVAALVALLGVRPPGRDDDGAALSSSGRATFAGAARARRVAACADLLVVGVDGNGEGPRRGATFGRTVAGAVDRFAAAVKAENDGRTVRRVRVPLSTPPISKLVAGHRKSADAGDAVTSTALREWRRTVPDGIRATRDLLDRAAASCPHQQVVLVGYAQGASVVHRVLNQRAAAGTLAPIAGAVLVSDPDRRYQTHSRILGAPAASAEGTGIVVHRAATPPDDVPPPGETFGVLNVCTAGDLVCDPGTTSLARASRLARSYADGGNRTLRALDTVGARVGALARQWPAATPRTQVARGASGRPMRLPLSVTVADRARAGVVWETTTALPPGLTLGTDGLLSGTPNGNGTWNVPYTVRGTAPATGPLDGILVISILPGSVDISAAGQSSCQTMQDGTAYCWGRNDYGQIGDGTRDRRYQPTQVLGSGWAQVSAGGATTCGIKTTGRLQCWGLNNFGQAGLGQTGPIAKPRDVGSATWSDVALAWAHGCGLQTDASLWCWGQNVRGSAGQAKSSRMVGRPTRVGKATWSSVAVGGWHSCAVRSDGSAWCWGDNQLGQLGLGDTERRTAPTRIGSDTDWVQLSTGYGTTCGLKRTGALWCWGLGDRGQIGDGSTATRLRPTLVAGPGIWTAVAVSDRSTCALDNAGGTWCWGDNRYGQVVTGDRDVHTTPVQRSAPTGSTLIAAGWLHTCASQVGQSITCWGSDEVGQLGTTDTAPTGRARAGGDTDGTRADDAAALAAADGVDPTMTRAKSRRLAASRADRVRGLTADEVVEAEIGDRPQPSSSRSARADLAPLRLMTFNVLGTQHTAPGGSGSDWAPGRIRAEWSDELMRVRGADLVGTQELQPDQLSSFMLATGGRFDAYPGNTLGYDGVPQSVMWDANRWELTWKDTISVPFMNGYRPQPLVRLRDRSSGRQVYFVNVHFSPGTQEKDRDRATAIMIKAIKRLSKDGLPVLLTGDFNEREELYCKVTGQTDLAAAIGGSTGKDCRPPRGMRVDQIFASRGSLRNYTIDQGPLVQRVTDHSVGVVTFTAR